MLGFHKVLPIIVLMSKVDACPYLLRRQGKSDTHEANANRKLKAQGSNNFFYARFFSEADAAPFTTSAYNLIEASRPDGSYMDEDGRSSRGSLILPDGSTFTDFRLRGTPEAVSVSALPIRSPTYVFIPLTFFSFGDTEGSCRIQLPRTASQP